MKTSIKKKNIFKKVVLVVISIYVFYILIHQQSILDSYKKSEDYYQGQIEEKIAYRETLYKTKENINSEEYIEEVAREKLDMYLPNEKVFIDI